MDTLTLIFMILMAPLLLAVIVILYIGLIKIIIETRRNLINYHKKSKGLIVWIAGIMFTILLILLSLLFFFLR
jgi:hypothetical protein